jgi:hypothetical protein
MSFFYEFMFYVLKKQEYVIHNTFIFVIKCYKLDKRNFGVYNPLILKSQYSLINIQNLYYLFKTYNYTTTK